MTGFQIRLWSVFYNVPRKELAIAPVKKCFAFTTNKLAVSSTTETSLENRIFVDVFLIEDMSMLL